MGRLQRDKWSQHESVRLASVIIGVVAVLLSMFVGQLATNLLELCIKVVNLLTAPLFVLLFLALFVPWAKPRGGITATIASVGVAVGIAFFKLGGLEFLWTAPAAFVTGIVVGSLASRPQSRRRENEKWRMKKEKQRRQTHQRNLHFSFSISHFSFSSPISHWIAPCNFVH